MLRANTFVANGQPSEAQTDPPPRKALSRRGILTALCASVLSGAEPSFARGSRPIVVASKSDTEGALTGSLIALILEGLGLTVERKLGLGPTLIVRSALLAGEVDIYPEYTGNGAFFSGTDTDAVWKTGEGGYERIRALDAERGLVWLKPAPANNTWLIAVRGNLARERGLSSMADFASAVRDDLITLAASTEFVESPAALPSFEAAYGFTMPRNRIFSLPAGDTAVTARAAAEGISGVNAGMVYGTDGALAALDLAVMSDPKAAQIVYEVAPVIRAETLTRHPGMREALDLIFAQLDADTLRRLNARITVEGETADAVARNYLAGAGAAP